MPKEGAEKGIIAALEAKAQEHGIDIVDVEVVGATKNPCVRVRIDHADEQAPAITLDEVTVETGWISDAIDELDPFPAAFTLEVSSPGLDRPAAPRARLRPLRRLRRQPLHHGHRGAPQVLRAPGGRGGRPRGSHL